MSATATLCQCCKEDCGKLEGFSDHLGIICSDCAKGVFDGVRILARLRVGGVFTGPCPDNGSEGLK